MDNEKKLLLKSASEPTFFQTKSGGTVRTHERSVQLYKTEDGYAVETSNDRGPLEFEDDLDLGEALSKFDSAVESCDMEEASQNTIDAENKNLTLEDIVRLYGEEGDDLRGGVDMLEELLKEDVKGIRFSYKTLMNRIEDSWIKATIRRGKEKLFVYFEGWMIAKIETNN